MKRVSTSILTGLALLLGCRLAMAELQPETLTVGKLPPANPHRIYLSDLGGLGHVVDGRIHLVDGDSYKYLGAIPAAMFALTALSPDSSEMYLATTYYTKLNRGKRFDQFDGELEKMNYLVEGVIGSIPG